MTEAQLQSRIIRWLKDCGAYVVKTRPGMGTPVGCPDVLFFYGDRYGVIEVKRSLAASFRPGQQATLQRFRDWDAPAYVATPETWPVIRFQIVEQFSFDISV